jgi:hypothetical protein
MKTGFKRLLLEVRGMNLSQINDWLKHLSIDELDDIVFDTEYITKQALKQMTETNDCLKAIDLGFEYYGLNGFYEMHKGVCDKTENKWTNELEVLNELNYEDFESLCTAFLNK